MCGMHWDPDALSDGLERADTAASLAPSSAAAPRQTRPSLNALGAWGPWRAPAARDSGEPRRPSGARPWSAVPPHAPSALRRPAATRVGALPGSPAVCDDDPPDLGDTKAAGLLSALTEAGRNGISTQRCGAAIPPASVSAPWNQRLGPLRALGALPISGSVRAW